MKILVVGGTGLIGKAVAKALAKEHDVITASLNSGDVQVDITSTDSIKNMYEQVDNLDAVISTTGKVKFATLDKLNHDAYLFGLLNKTLGQINLVSVGQHYINDGGSFTLTSGVLNKDPIVTGSSAAMANGAIDGFVTSAAIEMPNQQRLNVVSPTVILEAMPAYEAYFKGFIPVPVDRAAQAYVKCVEGKLNGKVIEVL